MAVVMNRLVYLDNLATTPILPEVLEAMLPFLKERFGNPSSLHAVGREAKEALEQARAKVAALIGADTEEIFFTSSGAESNNFALKGVALALQRKGNHIIVSAIEHDSVRHSARWLQKLGFEVSCLPVDGYGFVSPDDVRSAITPRTVLVSVMHANNEIGTIQPIAEIAKVVKETGVLLHTDAVASVGHLPINVRELGVDLLSLSGHQFYGPKGTAALYIRQGVRILPFIDGGIQEGGRRAGTENLAGLVGLGAAAEAAMRELPERAERIAALRDRLIEGLMERIDRVRLNGHPKLRLPHNASLSFEFVEGEALTMLLDMRGIAVSTGSACASRALKTSHVLEAIGVESALAQGTLLFSPGCGNSEEDVDYALEVVPEVVARLREMSPSYEPI